MDGAHQVEPSTRSDDSYSESPLEGSKRPVSSEGTTSPPAKISSVGYTVPAAVARYKRSVSGEDTSTPPAKISSEEHTDKSVDAILQEFRDEILRNVNAKTCAPELRRHGVIAASTETDIERAKDPRSACGVLYDHLCQNCSFKQIVMLSTVLMEVDDGFGRTKEVGERLHMRINGSDPGGSDQQLSLQRLPKNITSTEKLPPKVEEEQNKVGVKEKEVGGNELLSRVQELQDELKRSDQERIELTDSNTALQSELDASKQEITSLEEKLLSMQRKQEFVFQSEENSGAGSNFLKLPPLPVAMNVISSVIFENKIYISGTREDDMPKSCQIHVYSLKDAAWSTLPEAPIYNADIVFVNDQITLLGGCAVKTDEPTDIVWSWIEKEGRWGHSMLSPMPRARMAIAVCHYGNILIVAGGAVENGTDRTAVNRVDVYNFTSQQWNTPPELQLPEARRSHFLVCFEGYIYATGGSSSFHEDSAFSCNTWRVKCTDLEKAVQFPAAMSEKCLWKPTTDLPVLRSTVVSCETSILSVGGMKDRKPQDVIYRLVRKQDGNHWIKVGNMNIGKFRHAVVPLGSHTLFVAGGYVWDEYDLCERRSASVEVVAL